MRFLATFIPDRRHAPGPPSPEYRERMNAFVEQSMKSGALLATGGLMPLAKGGARLTCSEGEVTVLDGPFTEAKEVVGGFALLQAASKEEAIEMVRQFHKVAGDGVSELHRIMEPDDEISRP